MTARRSLTSGVIALLSLGLAACDGTDAATDVGERFPDVIAVAAVSDDDGTWTFDVTISSRYDSPERYADGWRIIGADGTVYGEHTLTHDHAGEQPFTRRQRGVEIPRHVDEVTVEGRDSVNGFGGGSTRVTLAVSAP